ncbi:NAD-dependent epimerase/dehydratase family protein [bacterium]|jgi:UDP-glucuronate 4-epimerase|nr:NAD-dependent epimerase/dehydratase family protein [bacterium]
MIFLVTGAAGFIGSNFVEHLLTDDRNEIFAIDSFDEFYSSDIKRKNCRLFQNHPRVHIEELDINDTEKFQFSVLRFLESRNEDNKKEIHVIHFAARPGVSQSFKTPDLTNISNVLGTKSVLQISRIIGATSFVFSSSSSVYGKLDCIPFHEELNLGVTMSPYAESKIEGENLCRAFALKNKNCSVRALRFFTVYGGRQRPDMAITKFAIAANANKKIVLHNNGNNYRDFTHVKDVLKGIQLIIDNASPGFDIFNIGSGKSIEIEKLASIITTCLESKSIISKGIAIEGDMVRTQADISKIEKLGYTPGILIEDGVKTFLDEDVIPIKE